MGKTYTIDIQKALSFPHTVNQMADGDKRCAVGAIFSAIEWDTPITSDYCQSEETGKWMSDNLLSPYLISVTRINDIHCQSDLERDLLRRRVIMDLIQSGLLVPAATDRTLAQELKELVKQPCTIQ